MSGGVDSSVAAALLVEQGYDVVGVMLRLWAGGWSEDTPAGNRCCSLDAVEDARRLADQFGFPFYLINAEDDFKSHVLDYFLAEYAAGRTPNPCTACNHHIKFDFLLRRAMALDAGYLATGHYARLRALPDGTVQLLRAADEAKDQSYMLYMLGQERLRRVMFPLGELTKAQVRAEAERLGLSMAHKKDSQEICFVGADYRSFLAEHIPDAIAEGELVDPSGAVVGRHQGLPLYTIGQRSGLGAVAAQVRPSPAAGGECEGEGTRRQPQRTYVLALDPQNNRITVGPESSLYRSNLTLREAAFNQDPPTHPVEAKIRSHGQLARCRIERRGESLRVQFEEPQRAVSPGQIVVVYDGDVVLGGGIID
ncbi:MAG: tRNA 2-thiouridine(34) synthase MnmA [Chloroflexi bacterium]|nr:tRNA 2-thiouridine(34) synthase MnmA [Chloroflexota bacterium]